MDTKDIRGFMRSYELRSINKASADLFITPQGLGKSINRLEGELGVKLFQRTPNGLIPTEAGDYFYAKSTELSQFTQDMLQGVQNRGEPQRKFRIGYSCGILNLLDIARLEEFCRSHTELSVTWEENSNDQIKEMMQTGLLNAAFIIGHLPVASLYQEVLQTRKYMAILPKNHSLCSRDSLSMEDLRNEPLICLNEKYQSYYNIVARCRDFGFLPSIRVKTMDSILLYKLAAQGVGIGIDADLHREDFSELPLEMIEIRDAIPWTVNLVYDSQPDGLMEELKATFRSE